MAKRQRVGDMGERAGRDGYDMDAHIKDVFGSLFDVLHKAKKERRTSSAVTMSSPQPVRTTTTKNSGQG